jgi:beta-glucosidase-like glycosyl hydrolase/CubicO group peptidase (beta-lactamase class C family)
MRTISIGIFLLLVFPFLFAVRAQHIQKVEGPNVILEKGRMWADSVYRALSPEERIAQLFWVAVTASGKPVVDHPQIDMLKKWQPGGIIFFKNEPQQVVEMIDYMQSLSRVPLFTVADAEWGLGMRFSNTLSFPYAMALGAIQDNSLIYRLGLEVAREFREMGIYVNLAPVADVNNNPANPVIGFRSYGEDPDRVAVKAGMFMQGLQAGGVMAVAKHFPGHGDTDQDSHKTLPFISHPRTHLNEIELKPFSELVNLGVWGVMTAHLEVPALESKPGLPVSFSRAAINGVLRDSLGFKGLVVTDAMNMKGAKMMGNPGEVDALALMAGNDIIEYTEDLPGSIGAVKRKLADGSLRWTQIEDKCKRSLAFKYQLGLTSPPAMVDSCLMERLNTPAARLLQRELFEQSATVLVNEQSVIPLKALDEGSMACVVIGEAPQFEDRVNDYLEMPVIRIQLKSEESVASALKQLKSFDRLVVGITDCKGTRSAAELKSRMALVEVLKEKSSVVAFLGNPYQLPGWKGLASVQGLLIAYQNNAVVQDVAAQVFFGGVSAKGRLPVSVKGLFPLGSGLDTEGGMRLKYTLAEEVGLNSRGIEHQVDSIVQQGIDLKAFPGCQVLVACQGKVIFNKAYGYHTYSRKQPVDLHDLYDLASVTKVTGPLPLIMKMEGEGVLDLDAPLSTYFDDWRSRLFHPSNKEGLILRDILAHQAGLVPYLNYWPRTMKNGSYSHRWFRPQEEPDFSLEVSDHLFLKNTFFRQVKKSVRKSELLPARKYKYSGLSFLVFPGIISDLTGEDYEQLLYSSFYKPLGASTLTYNPLHRFPRERIIPTEVDNYFRNEQVHGRVHDEAAAVLGGVSGNAGLFASANDMAKLLQMYLNGGIYGGKRFFPKSTIDEFTRVQFPENDNRRGLGFDKPLPDNGELAAEKAYPAPGVSPQSYGHSGFTGTFIWVDPANEMIYVFFSNRVFPTRDNSLIYDLNIRTSVQQVFYECTIL